MKLISITRSDRRQPLCIISDVFKLHKVEGISITVTTTNALGTKDMFLTFSRQEVMTLLSYFEERDRNLDSFVSDMKAKSNTGTPNDSGDNSGPLV